MTKPVNNYKKLKELFAQDRATGDGAETAKEKKHRWEKVMETSESITINDIDLDDDITLESYGNDFSERNVPSRSFSRNTFKWKKEKGFSCGEKD